MTGLLEREAWQQRWLPTTWLETHCTHQVDAAGRGVLGVATNSRYSLRLALDPAEGSMQQPRSLRPISGDVTIGAALPAELVFHFDPRQLRAARSR